jgi:ribonuclease P protein component
MVVFALEREHADRVGPRLGITASRRVGNAVVRARSKRRIRELFRTNVGVSGGRDVDLVVNARRGLAAASWPELEQEFRRTVKRLRDRLASG